MQTGSPGGFQPGQQPASALGTQPTPSSLSSYASKPVNGGRFDFDDGGTYCGGWEDGKAHGHGVCTGPKGQGEYSGSWHFGFEVSGVYTWPSGSTFEGQWQNGKRHGLGMEYRGRWTYRGEWTQGFKGRYGVRQATASTAKYEGTWANGLQDGYGSEAYADGGTYQGQWLRGLRHGYGVRTSAPFGMASHFRPKAQTGSMQSLKSDSAAEPTSERDRRMDDVRGGFVLKARSDDPPGRRRSLVEKSSNIKESILKGLKLRKQRSTGDLDKKGTTTNTSIRSTVSSSSWMSNESAQSGVTSGSHHTDSNASFVVEDEHMDTNVTETYMGEWKNDKRSGFGISERSDGLKYEGEWYNNKKYGYGVTTLKDGTKEEGKYKNNVLITSQKKKHLFLMRSAKFRERIDAAVNAAQRASKIALQKADIAISRTATARGKSEQADIAAGHAREDSEIARVIAKQFAPDFHQPGTEIVKPKLNQPQSHQPQVADLRSKIGPNMVDERSQVNSSRHSREREMSMEPCYGTEPPQPSAYQQHNSQMTHNNPNSAYNSIPDRIDGPSRLHESSSQIDQHRNANERAQIYQTRLSHQDLHSTGQKGQGSHGGQMGNNIGNNPGRLRDTMGNSVGGRQPPPPSNPNQASHSQHFQSAYGNCGNADMGGGGGGGYDHGAGILRERGRDTVRRSSQMQRPNNPHPSSYNYQQAMSDHFDHYKRPPSRDRESSRDRGYSRQRSITRAPTPELGPSRAQSRARTPFEQPPPISPAPSQNPIRSSNVNLEGMDGGLRRGETPSRKQGAENIGSKFSDTSSNHGSGGIDESLLKQRGGLGQEIHPALYTPKRTESLFLKCGDSNTQTLLIPQPPSKMSGTGPTGMPLKRKKSLPDVASLPKATAGMSREEISALGSARRQELHRLQDEAERKRANPLLYLLNPNFKNWFSRQKLMVLVLLVNLSLAIMFLQLLT